ncbi:uncharacterized protein LOC128337069 isoform X2 [Hemicordylus capensis]|uniref:uncharacterized protein LOC128337069 isoform X2 n=1 Tax=Hemicordylus capensis TaxID=884348 RepID=UPI00230327D4|nr:uncharacterized protein LOC128337069 isoform X2 [Hemicordylus capensis]
MDPVHGVLKKVGGSIYHHWALYRCNGYLVHQAYGGNSGLVPQQEPQPGDLVEIFRGFYSHWAVFVGDGYVVHLASAGPSSSLVQSVHPKKVVVKKELLQDVAGNHNYRVNNKQDLKCHPRPVKYILHDAEAEVGKPVEYDMTSWNCEHFAKYLRYGIPICEQVPAPEDPAEMPRSTDEDWSLCLDISEGFSQAQTGAVCPKNVVVKNELPKDVVGKHNSPVNNQQDLKCHLKPLKNSFHEAEVEVEESVEYDVASRNGKQFAKYLRCSIPVSEQVPAPEDPAEMPRSPDEDWSLCLDISEGFSQAQTGLQSKGDALLLWGKKVPADEVMNSVLLETSC